MSDTYLAFPEVDRRCAQGELGPKWLLRYWYVARELPASPAPTKTSVRAAWEARLGVLPAVARKALSAGMGAWWQEDPAGFRLRTPEELAGAPGPGVAYPVGPLLRGGQELDALQVQAAIERHLPHGAHGGGERSLSLPELAAATGFSSRSIQRYLQRIPADVLRRLPTWDVLEERETHGRMRRLQRQNPSAYIAQIPRTNLVGKRAPNSYQVLRPVTRGAVTARSGRDEAIERGILIPEPGPSGVRLYRQTVPFRSEKERRESLDSGGAGRS